MPKEPMEQQAGNPAEIVIDDYLIKPGQNVIEMPADGKVLSVQPRGPVDIVLQVQHARGAPVVARTFWLEDDLDLVGQFIVRGRAFDLFEDRSK